MTGPRKELIDDLVADLRPVRRAGHVGRFLAMWSMFALLYTAGILAAIDPFREGAWRSLALFPTFAAETAVAVLAAFALARAALMSGLPGVGGPLRSLAWPAALMTAWLAFYAAGLSGWPAHPVAESGHRAHCFLETLLIGLPTLGLMLWYAGRLAPQAPRLTGMLAGAAAAAVPAVLMQFACMYSPAHSVAYHLVPIAIMAAAGASCAPALLIRRRTVARELQATLH